VRFGAVSRNNRHVQLKDGLFLLSPSDLVGYLACPHLTTLSLAVVRGELERPHRHNPHADLIARKGDEHEGRYLAALRDAGRDVVEVGVGDVRDFDRAALATVEAIAQSPDIVYQAVFSHDGWRGLADFLERQSDGSYEAVDTKLARHARPGHLLQLCFYTEQLERLSGRRPAAMHIVSGLGERETYRPEEFEVYYRRLRDRFLAAIAKGRDTYPYPVDHCSLCEFLARCKHQWRDDDHLSLVAGIARTQVELLTAAELATMTALGDAPPGTRVQRLRQQTFEGLRHQAELQLHRRRRGEHRVDRLPAEPEHGFAAMPEPTDGDVWLDLEGDPWFEPDRGLEFLFGWIYLEDGEPCYDCIWARSRAEERAGFERLIDLVAERRRRFLGMHVYHYAAYERTALRRLMGQHGTREQELDDLLRGEVLVDLFRVTKQALRASVESYSIKDVEELYSFERRAELTGGGASVLFEDWLEVQEPAILEEIRAYNEDDCRSLYELHRWLLGLRPADLPWLQPPEAREQKEEAQERLAELEQLVDQLLVGAEDGEPRWLLAQLLEYHRREEKPAWWEYFHHLSLDAEELIEDGDTIGGLELAGEPEPDKQSLVYTFEFPPQEHKIGGKCVDPATEKSYDVQVNDEHGVVTLRRAKRRENEPLPRALIPTRPIGDYEQRDAVKRFAHDYLAGSGRYPALRDILERRPPRARLDLPPVEAATTVDSSYLFVQGPPGSGKTWTGARMAVALMQEGHRVGITSRSHKAIQKFLEDVRSAAREAGFTFKGRKKGDAEDDRYEDEFVDCTDDNAAMLDTELRLIAGTAWLFSREELDQHVDTLFVDEAGQVALADVIAVGTAAGNLILLGDPNQLPQVSQGSHPPGADASVLAHLLGEDQTVRPEMGLFLQHTWRMREEVCRYISDTFYEGRLHPADVCAERSVELGNGVRFLEVEHSGHRQASPEEAQAVAVEIERLLGTPFCDEHGPRTLGPADVVVVAPYNAHVRRLREAIPDTGIRIGTVDKFQGQQAAVVFYSMASSGGEDVPRGLEFLFSRNRLNVAISRAQCLAYLVCSPRLLEVSCRTVEQMRLANALCRFVELAEAQRT
jgi:predicted RecB family nuclease